VSEWVGESVSDCLICQYIYMCVYVNHICVINVSVCVLDKYTYMYAHVRPLSPTHPLTPFVTHSLMSSLLTPSLHGALEVPKRGLGPANLWD